jgi:hypothetical protein
VIVGSVSKLPVFNARSWFRARMAVQLDAVCRKRTVYDAWALGRFCHCLHPPPSRTGIDLTPNAISFQSGCRGLAGLFFGWQPSIRLAASCRSGCLDCDSGRSPIGLCRERLGYDACRLVDQISLACCTRECQISLLQFACEELQGVHVCAFHLFGDRVHNCFWRVLLAPYSCNHGACFSVEGHRWHRIPS